MQSNKKGVLTFFMTILGLTSIVLGFLIYAKGNPNGTVFGVKMASINAKTDDLFSNIFTLNIFGKKEDEAVDASNMYTYLGNGKYKSEDSSIRCLNKGTVNHVEEDFMIVISYDNGVVASYYGIDETLVKVNDRMKPNDILASYSESFYAVFLKDNNTITYEEALH